MLTMRKPEATCSRCPECHSRTEVAEYSHTTASYDGEPEEHSGFATYCTNEECEHNFEPIE